MTKTGNEGQAKTGAPENAASKSAPENKGSGDAGNAEAAGKDPIADLLKGGNDDIEKGVADLTVEQLQAALTAEKAGQDRKGAKGFIEAAIAEKSKSSDEDDAGEFAVSDEQFASVSAMVADLPDDRLKAAEDHFQRMLAVIQGEIADRKAAEASDVKTVKAVFVKSKTIALPDGSKLVGDEGEECELPEHVFDEHSSGEDPSVKKAPKPKKAKKSDTE